MFHLYRRVGLNYWGKGVGDGHRSTLYAQWSPYATGYALVQTSGMRVRAVLHVRPVQTRSRCGRGYRYRSEPESADRVVAGKRPDVGETATYKYRRTSLETGGSGMEQRRATLSPSVWLLRSAPRVLAVSRACVVCCEAVKPRLAATCSQCCVVGQWVALPRRGTALACTPVAWIGLGMLTLDSEGGKATG